MVSNIIMNIEKGGNGKMLKWPRGVAVTQSGEIIVSDGGADTVSINKGSSSHQLPGSWHSPWGIAVDSNDDVYVCSGESIKVINKYGQIFMTLNCRGTWPDPFSPRPLFITVYKNHILVSDDGGNIHQLTTIGSYIKKLAVDNLQRASSLAVTAAQYLIIVDKAMPIWILTGYETVSAIGDHGSVSWQLNNPLGVAVTRCGQIIYCLWPGQEDLHRDTLVTSHYYSITYSTNHAYLHRFWRLRFCICV